jgi:hypothetical protein
MRTGYFRPGESTSSFVVACASLGQVPVERLVTWTTLAFEKLCNSATPQRVSPTRHADDLSKQGTVLCHDAQPAVCLLGFDVRTRGRKRDQ